MRRLACLLLAATLALLARADPPPEDAASDTTFGSVVRPFLEAWCVRCHAGAAPQAQLDLDRFRADTDVRANPGLWRRVRERLVRGEMPPLGQPRPPAPALQAVTAFLTEIVQPGEGGAPLRAGRVTARRLNRTEYENTVRDLLGVDFRADATFPADDVGHGFDNIGDVLSLPPVLLEKYLLAAETIARAAVADEFDEAPPRMAYEGKALEATGGASLAGRGPWTLYSTAEVHADHAFPSAGRYRLRAKAYALRAGPEPARLAFRIDGRDVGRVDVLAERDAPAVYEAVVPALDAGSHRVGAAFVNDFYDPQHPDPAQRDRNLYVYAIEVEGPLGAPALPPCQRRFVPLPRPADDDVRTLRSVLEAFAVRAWRRPVDAEEIDRLLALVARAAPDARFEERVRTALTAVLVSPHFLFRLEPDAEGTAPGRRPLTAFEWATRLAYFVWSSTPDDRLLALAANGALDDPAARRAEVDRLLDDPRSRALAEGFAAQWLQIKALDEARPDPDRFPGVDAALLADMRAETLALFEAVLRERRDARELVTADYTFVNERLARHYGLVGVRGPHLRRVSLTNTGRQGVLGHASVLTATSNPVRTSPVKRGKWVLEALLDQPPPPPPPGVGALDETKATLSAATLREQLALHRADPTCAACHDAMDPLGFALEHFDAVGRWRVQDGEQAIDASGMLPDGRVLEGADDLAALLASEHAFLRSLAKHLLVYALGRGVVSDDAPAVEGLVTALLEEPTLARLVHEIVLLDAFTHRTLVGRENPATETEDESR